MRKIFLLLAFVALSASAQDVIVKKDGTPILAMVMEINTDNVKYKKHDKQDGPTYTIAISDILSLTYANGEKEDFGNAKSTLAETSLSAKQSYNTETQQGLVRLPADARNAEIISQYNTIYQPSQKNKKNNNPAKTAIAIYGVKNKSIMSNKDIEMYINGLWNVLEFTNKTDRVIYIDKGNSFQIYSNGSSESFYDNSSQTTVTKGTGSGASLSLGSVAAALDIGGIVGQLASGVSVSKGSSSSVSTTYIDQRFIAIPPHATFSDCAINISVSFDYLKKGIVNYGQIKIFEEEELPWKTSVFVTYSTEEDFRTYSTLNVELYVHEIIGGGDWWNDDKNFKCIQDANEHTLNNCILLSKPKNRVQKR